MSDHEDIRNFLSISYAKGIEVNLLWQKESMEKMYDVTFLETAWLITNQFRMAERGSAFVRMVLRYQVHKKDVFGDEGLAKGNCYGR